MLGGVGNNLTLLGTYFAKQITVGKENFVTGVRTTHPWWKVEGMWPDDNSSDVLLGKHLAAKLGIRPGSFMEIAGQEHLVVGILSTGGPEDDQIVAPLRLAQQILDKPGAVRRVYVSALTKPEDALARRDPDPWGRSCTTAGIVRRIRNPSHTTCKKQFRTPMPNKSGRSRKTRARCFPALLD